MSLGMVLKCGTNPQTLWRWLQSLIAIKPITGPEVIKLFSCSTQLSMKFSPLINVKMPTIVGILTFMRGKNSILGISEPKNSRISWYLSTYEHLKFHAQLSWARKKFYNLGPSSRSLTVVYPYRSGSRLRAYQVIQGAPCLTETQKGQRHIDQRRHNIIRRSVDIGQYGVCVSLCETRKKKRKSLLYLINCSFNVCFYQTYFLYCFFPIHVYCRMCPCHRPV